MSRRRFWILVHRVNGLAIAGFLVIVGSTGSVLAWRMPLERVFAPGLFTLSGHARNASHADPIYVRNQVAISFPWAHVDLVDLSSAPGEPLNFPLTPRIATGSADRDDEAFADPYTGRVLGSRRNGAIRQGVKSLVPFIYELHEELALGSFGATCLGVAALLWTLDCFVGMYLSFPSSRNALFRDRLSQWFPRFKPSFLIRWRSGGFRRLYDSHRAAGVWLWLMLLIFAWTGVAFNLPAVYRRVMHLVGGTLTTEMGTTCASNPSSIDEPDWPKALRFAREAMQTQARERHFQILSERFLSYDRENCGWVYRVRSTFDVDQVGNTQLVWPEHSEAPVSFSAPTGSNRTDTLTTWIEAIHEAQVGGSAGRLLVSLTGIATVFLAITGVMIFLRKIGR